MIRSRRRNRSRGVTLIELLISLMVIVVGMLVVFRVLATSVASGQTSSRFAQAQQRAADIIEAIRLSPDAGITCLRNNPISQWASTCEPACQQAQLDYPLVPNAMKSSCIFTPGSFSNLAGPASGASATLNQSVDRQGQQYFFSPIVAPGATTAPAAYGGTYVRQVGDGLRTWEIAISLSWNDDNSTNTSPAPYPNHTVTLVSGVFK